ncbi:MAG: ATP-binding protein, partial [bacterium]
ANEDSIDEIMIQGGLQIDVLSNNLDHYYKSFGLALSVPFNAHPIPHTKMDSIHFLIDYRKNNFRYYDFLLPSDKMNGKMISADQLVHFMKFSPAGIYDSLTYIQSIKFITKIHNPHSQQWMFQYYTGWNPNEKRGIFTIDPITRDIQWEFLFGSFLNDYLVEDFNQDGEKEIILATYANGNGVTYNNFTDDSSYVFALQSDGKLLWSRSFGSRWTGVKIAKGNFQRDGKSNLFVYQFSSKNEPYNHLNIFMLEPLTGNILKKRSIGHQPMAANMQIENVKICRDFNGDGIDEIVIGNTDGIIRMLDHELKEIQSTDTYNRPVYINSVEDLNNDGRYEIVAVIRDERIIILDNELKELCSLEISNRMGININIVRDKKKNFLLLYSPESNQARYQMFELQQSRIPFPTEIISMNPYFWSLPFILGIIFLTVLFKTRKRSIFTLFLRLLAQAGVQDKILLINRKGNIQYMGEYLATILSLDPHQSINNHYKVVFGGEHFASFRNILEEIINYGQTQKYLSYSLDNKNQTIYLLFSTRYIPVFQVHSILITDTEKEMRIKQVKQWAQVAQKLAHGLKTPLTSLKLNAEELRHFLNKNNCKYGKESEDYFKAITGQIDRLKRMSDGFMRFVEFEKPDLKAININEKLTDWIPQKHSMYASRIRLHWDLKENLPNIRADEQQLKFAVQNIFSNALESIEDQGSINISTNLIEIMDDTHSQKKEVFEIQIQDTGAGIPADIIDKVFDPYITTKTGGTGLGLSIVKKIIESHNGKVIIRSDKETGTNVTIRLPVEYK